jgi:lysophospholipase L1-like esterase
LPPANASWVERRHLRKAVGKSGSTAQAGGSIVRTAVINTEKRQRSLRRKILYAAVPTVLAFLAIEGAFRLYFLMRGEAALAKLYERWSHNPAFTSKAWFSREFAAASLNQPPEGSTPVGTCIKVPGDYKDRFFTVKNGSRVTVGFDRAALPPGRRPRTLFVFGGSTTYCAEVPDEFTWASELQKLLSAIPETKDIEVINCGNNGAVALQEVERLEYEIGRNNVPDFVVFFDGDNEVFQGVVFGEPGGTQYGTYQKHTSASLFVILRRIAGISVAAQTIYHSILDSQRHNDLPHTRSQTKLRELSQQTADVYEQNLLRACEICKRHGIHMIVCLQPNMFTLNRPWTAQEKALQGEERKSHAAAFQTCYPFLREKLSKLKDQGVMAYDLSDAFDCTTDPIYVDGCHVESKGNRLIAEAILKRVRPILEGCSSLETAGPVEFKRRAKG